MTATQFGSELDKVSKTMKPYALRLTKDNENANDLLQETTMKAYVNRDKFSSGTNLKAWYYTIMRNTFITKYQRMKKRNTFIDITANLHYINSSGSTIHNEATSTFVMHNVNKAIEKLDDTYRLPFVMHFQGFKYYEIADRLNLPIGTVKNRIHIARKELKSVLKSYATR
jgi:RNA polymerase sigma-70 factor (ECF subfamily)